MTEGAKYGIMRGDGKQMTAPPSKKKVKPTYPLMVRGDGRAIGYCNLMALALRLGETD